MNEFRVYVLDDPAAVLTARRLHGRRYLDAGFVSSLDAGGVIDDPWVDHSVYFGAIDTRGKMLGVSRLIDHSVEGLPAFSHFPLTFEAQTRLALMDMSRVVEVSALAVEKGPAISRSGAVANSLYRSMYQHSVMRAGHTHWCAALDTRVKNHLITAHGFLFEDLGLPRDYLGSRTVPVLLDLLGQARDYAHTDPGQNAFFLDGLEIDLTSDPVTMSVASGGHIPRPLRRSARGRTMYMSVV